MISLTRLLAFTAAFLVLVVASLVALIAFGPHAFSLDKFAQVTIGMSEAEVLALTGEPCRIRRNSPSNTAFCYGGFARFRWCTMEVYFGPDGRVIGKFHDD